MADLDIKWLWEKVETQWHGKVGLIGAALIIVVVLLPVFSNVSIAAILLCLCLVWAVSRRIRKAKRGRVGVLLAFAGEKKHEKERLLGDFRVALKQLIGQASSKSRLQIVELPEYYVKKIETEEDARRFMMKARCMFMLRGRASVRRHRHELTNVLKLDGWVRHRPLKNEARKDLSEEFKRLLPALMTVPAEDDLFSFEVRAGYVASVAKYIIGVAAMYSRDFEYSSQLFGELADEMANVMSGDNLANILVGRVVSENSNGRREMSDLGSIFGHYGGDLFANSRTALSYGSAKYFDFTVNTS